MKQHFIYKGLFAVLVLALVAAFAIPLLAQESAVKGNLGGTVFDPSGAVVPDAKVTVTGPVGTMSVQSDASGRFAAMQLIPGSYAVKVEKQGFKSADVRNVEVVTNRTASLSVRLEAGQATETVEVRAEAIAVDTSSTAIGANITDTFYQKVPVQRGVAGLFYLSPGVASGGGSGAANPSISGGSGLENLYVADGVNITDSAFGGLGVFSRNFGSVGTGINLSFIKEVQVKTGGYEPQYGRATGGIVQIVTKTGSREFHGNVGGFFQPESFETDRLHPDDFRTNKAGKTLHQQAYDASGELGGYIPGFRDHIFFFGSFNPSWPRDIVLAPPGFGLNNFGEFNLRTNTYNYAGKLTFKLSENNTFEGSIFGDPSHTNRGPFVSLLYDNTTALSDQKYSTRNFAARWNSTISPSWLFNLSFTWGANKFREEGFDNVYQINDLTQTGGLTGQRGAFFSQGYGFNEPTNSDTYAATVDTQKTFHAGGEHAFSIGYHVERPFYNGSRLRSGPNFPIPATNIAGMPTTGFGVPAEDVGELSNAAFELNLAKASCTLCPLMNVPGLGAVPVVLRQRRGEFGPRGFGTSGLYHAAYANDSWSLNRFLTINMGLRWEQQRLSGEAIRYTFTDNWSPRVGVVVDPKGDRKTKLYANYGRYDYALPLDAAERSLTNELDFTGARYAPDFDPVTHFVRLNALGTVTPIPDAAHLLNKAPGGVTNSIFVSAQSTTGIAAGTRMEYVDEWVVGAEREIGGGVIFSVRYVDRRMKRIIEDASGIPPEGADASLNQIYLITNVNKQTDQFSNPIEHPFSDPANPPAACLDSTGTAPFVETGVTDSLGNTVAPGNVCFEPTAKNGQLPGTNVPDGIPDGFPNPLRNYQAVEIELNKSFSRNWQMRANWRIAKLFGNFEGAFRNDNGQTDPGISSLFDFVQGQFGLLGAQFKPGLLNTDRKHIVNAYVSYVADKSIVKGLTLGTGVRFETGTPISEFAAHPAYLNPGEVPIGGRGTLGRTQLDGSVDVHADYPIRTSEKTRLRLGMDLFNIANARRELRVDQNVDLGFGIPNVDFLLPYGGTGIAGVSSRTTAFQRPFYARASVRFEF